MITKDNLADQLAKKVGLSKGQASESLEAILEEIIKRLSQGEEVKLTGFGKFFVKESRGRKLPKFKAGQTLREAVR